MPGLDAGGLSATAKFAKLSQSIGTPPGDMVSATERRGKERWSGVFTIPGREQMSKGTSMKKDKKKPKKKR
jgi:hypothetical protein